MDTQEGFVRLFGDTNAYTNQGTKGDTNEDTNVTLSIRNILYKLNKTKNKRKRE